MVCNIQRCGKATSENNGDSHCSEVHSPGKNQGVNDEAK